MSTKLTTSIKDGVAIITLDDGKANALGSQTWAELNAALDEAETADAIVCLLYTSPSPRDRQKSRMPSSA